MSQYKDQITGDVLFDIRIVDNKYLYNKAPTKVKAVPWFKNGVNRKFEFSNFTNPINSNMICRSNGVSDYYLLKNPVYIGEKFTYTFWGYCPTPRSSIPGSGTNYPLFLTALRNQNESKSLFVMPLWNRLQYRVNTNASGTNTALSTYDMSSNYDQWNYFTVTRDGNNLYVFINGILLNTVNVSSLNLSSLEIHSFNIYDGYATMEYMSGYDLSYNFYVDDIVFINNQCLWTSNFDVPVTYLTDELETFKKSGILYAQYNSLYFDKAYLY